MRNKQRRLAPPFPSTEQSYFFPAATAAGPVFFCEAFVAGIAFLFVVALVFFFGAVF